MKPRLSYKTEAIVLRSIDYGESDRIVTFYTADYGKVKGIAKGARRSKKRFANTLETFSCLMLLFSRRSYDGLALIEEGTVINHYPGIAKDLTKSLLASYMVDITEQFAAEHKKNEELFLQLKGFLELFDLTKISEHLVRFFEMRLLKYAGYEPVLDRCLGCKEPVNNGGVYHFSLKEGGIKCHKCAASGYDTLVLSVGTIKSLLLGKDMERERLGCLLMSEQAALESRRCLGRFIEYLLGKEIKSLRVIREIRELGI